jgi:hypothetical protein
MTSPSVCGLDGVLLVERGEMDGRAAVSVRVTTGSTPHNSRRRSEVTTSCCSTTKESRTSRVDLGLAVWTWRSVS